MGDIIQFTAARKAFPPALRIASSHSVPNSPLEHLRAISNLESKAVSQLVEGINKVEDSARNLKAMTAKGAPQASKPEQRLKDALCLLRSALCDLSDPDLPIGA